MNNNFFDNNNCNDNSIYENALQKIQQDKKCRPTCCAGPRGATGPTGLLV